VILGTETEFAAETTQIWRRGHLTGSLSVDVDIDPKVDFLSLEASVKAISGAPKKDRSVLI
jgi:hypothetical protein